MKRVCAWCNKLIGSVAKTGDEDNIITHCICPDCANNPEFQLGVKLEKFLDSLQQPVILIDGAVNFIFANQQTMKFLGSEPDSLPGQPLGNVFECAYARHPEGCGKTVHCSGCAIRSSVNHTFTTGDPLEQVPAYIKRSAADTAPRIDMTISTRKWANMVMLTLVKVGS